MRPEERKGNRIQSCASLIYVTLKHLFARMMELLVFH